MRRHTTALLAIAPLLTVMGTASARNTLLPGRLAIYYGYPSLVNESGGDLDRATEVFENYDTVVFGDGLQYEHPDHQNTATIIGKLNNTSAYGYIPIGATNLPASQQALSVPEIKDRVVAWNLMGVTGVFLDQAGYDFGVTRERQNLVVEFVHSRGLSVFINAWMPEDVFSPAVDPTYNPTGAAPLLDGNDIYLLESFQIVLGKYQDATFWRSKSDRALTYKNQYGTRMATVTTASASDTAFHRDRSDYAWWSTLLYGFDLMGWGELYFSANSILPLRIRPDPGEVGSAFTSPSVAHDGSVHTRETTTGTILVNTDTHTGEFIHQTQPTAVEGRHGAGAPSAFSLSQNYPNPFNMATTITCDVAQAVALRLSVYALAGQHIRTLVHGQRQPGSYSVTWDGTDETGRTMASGVYLCRMEADKYSTIRKMLLVR